MSSSFCVTYTFLWWLKILFGKFRIYLVVFLECIEFVEIL